MTTEITVQANMTLNEYQQLASRTAIYPGRGTALGLSYVLHKLAGEAGEANEHFGKAMRDDDLVVVEQFDHREQTTVHFKKLRHDRLLAIRKEIGDQLWYLSQACYELSKQFGAEIFLGDIALENILKLQSRKERGVLTGSGDER